MSAGPKGPEIVVTWIKGSDCRIIDTWDTAGLRATGSIDIEVSDVFVPKHRTFPVPLVDPVGDAHCSAFPSSDVRCRNGDISARHRAGGDR